MNKNKNKYLKYKNKYLLFQNGSGFDKETIKDSHFENLNKFIALPFNESNLKIINHIQLIFHPDKNPDNSIKATEISQLLVNMKEHITNNDEKQYKDEMKNLKNKIIDWINDSADGEFLKSKLSFIKQQQQQYNPPPRPQAQYNPPPRQQQQYNPPPGPQQQYNPPPGPQAQQQPNIEELWIKYWNEHKTKYNNRLPYNYFVFKEEFIQYYLKNKNIPPPPDPQYRSYPGPGTSGPKEQDMEMEILWIKYWAENRQKFSHLSFNDLVRTKDNLKKEFYKNYKNQSSRPRPGPEYQQPRPGPEYQQPRPGPGPGPTPGPRPTPGPNYNFDNLYNQQILNCEQRVNNLNNQNKLLLEETNLLNNQNKLLFEETKLLKNMYYKK